LIITGDGIAHCEDGKTIEAGHAIRGTIGVKGATTDIGKGIVTFNYEVSSIPYFEDLAGKLEMVTGVTRIIIEGYNDEN